MRPDTARPGAHPPGVRGAASGHVPPAHRVSAEQDRRARVTPRGRRRRPGQLAALARDVPSIYVAPWRLDIPVRDGVTSTWTPAAIARPAAAALEAAGAPSPA